MPWNQECRPERRNMSSLAAIAESRLALTAEAGDKPLPNSVLAMIIFVAAEIMFFAGLMSAYTIARHTVLGSVWPPPGQPRLPVERTAANTPILIPRGIPLR